MKRLNNKGFAISTLLYSMIIMVMMIVMIMMSIMATTRKSTKELSETIEQELNGYAKTESEFTTTGSHSYTAPKKGWYKVESWIKGNRYYSQLYYFNVNDTLSFKIQLDNITEINLTSFPSAGTQNEVSSNNVNVPDTKRKVSWVSNNEDDTAPPHMGTTLLNNGKYYIAKEGTTKVLTVASDDGSVSFAPLNGEKNQEWIIEAVKDADGNIIYYKIISYATGLLLAPQEETGLEGTTVDAKTNSTIEYEWIKWNITENVSGQYKVSTKLLSGNTLTHNGTFQTSPTSDYLFNFIYSEY